jgi:hypothetical protein
MWDSAAQTVQTGTAPVFLIFGAALLILLAGAFVRLITSAFSSGGDSDD